MFSIHRRKEYQYEVGQLDDDLLMGFVELGIVQIELVDFLVLGGQGRGLHGLEEEVAEIGHVLVLEQGALGPDDVPDEHLVPLLPLPHHQEADEDVEVYLVNGVLLRIRVVFFFLVFLLVFLGLF